MVQARTYSDTEKQDIGAYAAVAGVPEAARVYQCPERTVRTFRAIHNTQGAETQPQPAAPLPAPPPPTPDTQESVEHELGPNAWTISMRSRTVATYEQLVAACEVNLADWEQVSFRARSYQITTVPRATRATDSEGWVRPTAEPTTTTMYALSAAFKKKVAVISAREEIESLVAEAKVAMPPRSPLILVKPPTTGLMLELSLPDAHLGKLSWGRETGGANYDLDIAVETYHRAIETLLVRSAQHRYERVLLLVGSDLLNSDSDDGKTTRGTPQDNDGRFFRTFQAARRMKVAVIERLVADVAPVDVIVMPGNHDRMSTLHLGDALACWFHGHENVTVDVEPTARKYYEFGRVMLGITHGDRGKPQLWSRLMPVERPAMWARTVHREVHAGHLHRDSAEKDELNGVKVRILPSLAPPDAWHAAEGYTTATQAAEAFHWHADDGLVGTAVYTVPRLKAVA